MKWPLRNPDDPDRLLSPQRYQLDFALSPAYATLMAGGWGSGKSFAGLLFCAWSSWSSPPGSVGIAIQPNFPMMEEWLQEQLLPAFERITIHHDIKRRFLVLPGRRKLYYKSAHDPRKVQISNASWVYLDEPHLMKREIWTHAVARARKKGARLRIGLTSLPKIGWLSEYFAGKNDGEYRCMHAKTAWNRHVSETYVRNLKRACPRRMWPAYLEGQFVPTGGTVYPEFDPKVHVIPWRFSESVQMADGSHSRPQVNLVMDPSTRRPHVLWAQRVPKGARMPGGWETKREVTVFSDEIYPDGQYRGVIYRRLCNWVKRREPAGYGRPWPFGEAVVDPAAGQRDMSATQVNESGITQLERYLGVPILYRTGERIKIGIQHVQLALDPAEGHPFIFFADSMRNPPDDDLTPEQQRQRSVLNAVPGYSYKDEKDGRLSEEPYHDDVFSHACDDVRYHTRFYYPEDQLELEKWSVL